MIILVVQFNSAHENTHIKYVWVDGGGGLDVGVVGVAKQVKEASVDLDGLETQVDPDVAKDGEEDDQDEAGPPGAGLQIRIWFLFRR